MAIAPPCHLPSSIEFPYHIREKVTQVDAGSYRGIVASFSKSHFFSGPMSLRADMGMTPPPPTWYEATAEAMNRLTALPDNWDSRRGRRIELSVVRQSLFFLSAVLPAPTAKPSVVPTVDGGIQTEWHMAGLNIEIEFHPSKDPVVMVEDLRNGTEWEGPLLESATTLRPYWVRLSSAQ